MLVRPLAVAVSCIVACVAFTLVVLLEPWALCLRPGARRAYFQRANF